MTTPPKTLADLAAAHAPTTVATKEDEEFEKAIAKEYKVSIEMIHTLRRTVAPPEATLADIAMYLATCVRLNLDPFTRQIYLLRIKGKNVLQIGIDGMFGLAENTKEYDGCDAPVYAYKDQKLFSATVRVYRKGMNRPIEATAIFSEYAFYQEPGSAWARMPSHMLGIAAYRIALRRAFPRTLSGLYGPEEMAYADTEAKPVPPPDRPALTDGGLTDETKNDLETRPAATPPVVPPLVPPPLPPSEAPAAPVPAALQPIPAGSVLRSSEDVAAPTATAPVVVPPPPAPEPSAPVVTAPPEPVAPKARAPSPPASPEDLVI